MKKIILDTNILVSSIISNSYPSKIVYELVLNYKVNLCLSMDVYNEYFEILNRKKFLNYSNFKENANQLLNFITKYSIFFEPKQNYDILKDKSDNKFLDLADISNADFLITGYFNDFDLKTFKETKIISAKEFWESIK